MNKILLVYEDYTELMNTESALKRVGFDVIGLSSEYAVSKQIVSFNPELVVASGSSNKVNSLSVGKRLKEMGRWQGKALLIFSPQLKPTALELIKIRADMILEAPLPLSRLLQVIAKTLGHDEAVLADRLKRTGGENPQKGFSTVISQPQSTPHLGEDSFLIRGKNAPEAEGIKKTSSFNIEPQTSDEEEQSDSIGTKRSFDFRIGSRMTNADKEEKIQGGANEDVFPDVDLKALEQELLNGGPVAVPSSQPAPLPEPEVSPSVKGFADAQRDIKQRVAKYQSFIAQVSVPSFSTMSRTETRKRQRQLTEEWNKKEIEQLDELRREFAKALFKK